MTTPLRKKGTRYYLRKSYDGKQREVALNTDQKKVATTGANRFLATLGESGWDAAVEELAGKRILKKGGSPTFEQMKGFYKGYLATCEKPPAPSTVKLNLRNLGRCYEISAARTLQQIDLGKVRATLIPDNATDSQRRSYSTVIRTAKSVFKKRAMIFYKSRGYKFSNPFEDAEITSPKVLHYIPLSQKVREAVF